MKLKLIMIEKKKSMPNLDIEIWNEMASQGEETIAR